MFFFSCLLSVGQGSKGNYSGGRKTNTLRNAQGLQRHDSMIRLCGKSCCLLDSWNCAGKPQEMCADPTASTFAEATRLLLAVLGFICEGEMVDRCFNRAVNFIMLAAAQGACPPMLRNHVVTRGPYSLSWHGISPTDLLREWFDGDELPLGRQTCNVRRRSTMAARRP